MPGCPTGPSEYDDVMMTATDEAGMRSSLIELTLVSASHVLLAARSATRDVVGPLAVPAAAEAGGGDGRARRRFRRPHVPSDGLRQVVVRVPPDGRHVEVVIVGWQPTVGELPIVTALL